MRLRVSRSFATQTEILPLPSFFLLAFHPIINDRNCHWKSLLTTTNKHPALGRLTFELNQWTFKQWRMGSCPPSPSPELQDTNTLVTTPQRHSQPHQDPRGWRSTLTSSLRCYTQLHLPSTPNPGCGTDMADSHSPLCLSTRNPVFSRYFAIGNKRLPVPSLSCSQLQPIKLYWYVGSRREMTPWGGEATFPFFFSISSQKGELEHQHLSRARRWA